MRCGRATDARLWRQKVAVPTGIVAKDVYFAVAGLQGVVTKCKFRGRRGILRDVMKFGRSLARSIDFEVANFQLLVKTRRKTLIFELQLVKIERLARHARFGAVTSVIACL